MTLTDDLVDNPVDLTNGLVAWYPFDGNTSDMSGNGYHGTVSNATPGIDRHGTANRAYDFSGSAYIDLNSTFEGLTTFTNSFWMKVGQSNTQSISLFYNANGAWGYSNSFSGYGKVLTAYINHSRQAVVSQQNKDRYLYPATDFGNWTHVVVVGKSNRTYLVYFDGQLTSSVQGPLTDHTDAQNMTFSRLGGNPVYSNKPDRSLDDLRIYNRALSAAEISALYDLENTPPNTSPAFSGTYTFSAAENNASATFLVSATDPDANTTLVYSMSGADADKFTLNASSGMLSFANPPDYESNASATGDNLYTLTVSVSDGNATASQAVTVTVTDIYEPSQANHTVDLNSTVNLEMIWVEPGTFTMGQVGVAEPVHDVTLTKGLYLGKYEVTQAQYEAVMMGNTDGLSATPSNWFNNPNRPVEKVSWDDAQKFLIRLNELEQENVLLGWAYILPTEAEWEYACRSGTTTAFSWGSTINSEHANGPSSGYAKTRNVGLYPANPWGFFDMHGNVWEWTADASGSYSAGSQVDPYKQGGADSYRVSRGGSWGFSDEHLRSARRAFDLSNHRNGGFGFRLAYKYTNKSPHDLNSTAPLTISENQLAGAIVGEFNATDPDVNSTLTYHLVSGTGDGNNSLFTLDTNGTLRTAVTFDYESNASTYSIRVQAKDEYNATVEGNFTVSLMDQVNIVSGPPVYSKSVVDGYAKLARQVRGGDLDGDGDIDLISAGVGSNQGGVSWYRNDGYQNFTEILIDSNLQAESVDIGDLDGDGDLDVAAAGGMLYWYENNGTESFTRHSLTINSNGSRRVQVVDMDGDGLKDLLVGSTGDSTLSWYKNIPSVGLSVRIVTEQANNLRDVKAIDFNHDGIMEIIVANMGANKVSLWQKFGENYSETIISESVASVHGVDAADFDLDGQVDFVSSSLADNTITLHRNSFGIDFNDVVISNSISQPWTVHASDLDSDGDPDFAGGYTGTR